jgi:cytochrome c
VIRIALLLALGGAIFAATAGPVDDQMKRLATDSGCMLCHSTRPAKPAGDAVLPPAPAWSEVASRYKGRPGAEDRLVAIVISGSGPNDRHWKGKTSATVMPGNPVEISEEDARKLIHWILR